MTVLQTEINCEHPGTTIDVNFTVENAIQVLNKEGFGGESDDKDGDFLSEIINAAAESSRHRLQELQFDQEAIFD